VIVDGAHSFGHFPFVRDDLDCDYYGTSLHKWLFAPFGSGMLYVRKEKIPALWPLMAAEEKSTADIRKFEQFGTHPIPIFLAIAEALTFHEALGLERKTARLVFLRDRWVGALRDNPRVRLNTNLAAGLAAGIANVGVEGLDTVELQRWLWAEHQVYTTAIQHKGIDDEAEFDGLRISPSVYTTLEEIDRFVQAMRHALDHGLPS
jgi:selenocysteine lyase/cysteine desulfurase